MNILALDTSSEACSVALLKGTNSGDEIISQHQIAPRQQAKLILPMIQAVLDTACLKQHDLEAIAYGCGPGSFTGIRIANSVAQGLGLALNKPLIPISSLAAMAQAAHLDQHFKQFLVAVDARAHQIYWSAYKANTHGLVELIAEEIICRPEEIPSCYEDTKWYGIGNGWKVYEAPLTKRLGFKPCAMDFSQHPKASAMVKLAKRQFEKGDHVAVSNAVSIYLN